MPFLYRDGVALYVEHTAGRAPPVLLIHGWCCDHRYMAPLAEHFARQGHAVVSLDLRGHGRSDKPQQAYPISAFADDVARCCRELQLRSDKALRYASSIRHADEASPNRGLSRG